LAAGEEDRERAIAGKGRRALAERIVARDQPARDRHGRGLKQSDRKASAERNTNTATRDTAAASNALTYWRAIKHPQEREGQSLIPILPARRLSTKGRDQGAVE
jgi:hypothetical protein